MLKVWIARSGFWCASVFVDTDVEMLSSDLKAIDRRLVFPPSQDSGSPIVAASLRVSSCTYNQTSGLHDNRLVRSTDAVSKMFHLQPSFDPTGCGPKCIISYVKSTIDSRILDISSSVRNLNNADRNAALPDDQS